DAPPETVPRAGGVLQRGPQAAPPFLGRRPPRSHLLQDETSALQTEPLCRRVRIPAPAGPALVEPVMPPIPVRIFHLRSNSGIARRTFPLLKSLPHPGGLARRRVSARRRDRARVPGNALAFRAKTIGTGPSLDRPGHRRGFR